MPRSKLGGNSEPWSEIYYHRHRALFRFKGALLGGPLSVAYLHP